MKNAKKNNMLMVPIGIGIVLVIAGFFITSNNVNHHSSVTYDSNINNQHIHNQASSTPDSRTQEVWYGESMSQPAIVSALINQTHMIEDFMHNNFKSDYKVAYEPDNAKRLHEILNNNDSLKQMQIEVALGIPNAEHFVIEFRNVGSGNCHGFLDALGKSGESPSNYNPCGSKKDYGSVQVISN
jgi:hypothetical protein